MEFFYGPTGIQNARYREREHVSLFFNLKGDAMKTLVRSSNQARTDLSHHTSQSIFTIVSAAALLIGIWGAACLISGLVSNNALAMFKGYIAAITGF